MALPFKNNLLTSLGRRTKHSRANNGQQYGWADCDGPLTSTAEPAGNSCILWHVYDLETHTHYILHTHTHTHTHILSCSFALWWHALVMRLRSYLRHCSDKPSVCVSEATLAFSSVGKRTNGWWGQRAGEHTHTQTHTMLQEETVAGTMIRQLVRSWTFLCDAARLKPASPSLLSVFRWHVTEETRLLFY